MKSKQILADRKRNRGLPFSEERNSLEAFCSGGIYSTDYFGTRFSSSVGVDHVYSRVLSEKRSRIRFNITSGWRARTHRKDPLHMCPWCGGARHARKFCMGLAGQQTVLWCMSISRTVLSFGSMHDRCRKWRHAPRDCPAGNTTLLPLYSKQRA